ncbi:MAG: hypothetical protein SWO11_06340 [Thermodesulfobacteriota bacterium]|nr:hypothetical protein [Thermodesulfobacteriota bacterium]
MSYRISYMATILIAVLFLIAGCQNALVLEDPYSTSSFQQIKKEEENNIPLPPMPDPGVLKSEPSSKSSPSRVLYPISISRLKSSIRSLEAFRLFSYHVLIQKDTETFKTLKLAALEYIEKYINPFLNEYEIADNPEKSSYVAALLYLKANLFLLYDDNLAFFNTLEELKTRFPKQMKETKVFHFDTGSILIEDGFKRIEERLRFRDNSRNPQ